VAILHLNNLTSPFNTEIAFNELTQSNLGKEVINKLWVNRDKSNPDFGRSEVTTWNVDTIPTSIVGIQVDAARKYALVYYVGLPDYVITEPGIGNEPTNQYGILKIPTAPITETDIVHTLTSSGNVGIFINGSGIFNYTDTFTWEQGGVWSYEAFKAEAATIAHRSSLPGWAVANWDGKATSNTSVLNLSGLAKSAALYSDGVIDGVISYSGTDATLATEIAWYNNAANGYSLKEDASGYAYWENTVALPDNSRTVKTQNYLLKSSDLWGPGYDETIQPGLYPTDRKDEFSFTAAVGSFAEDYEFVQGYGDLDFYNGIDSYIPDLGKSEYHYVTTFSSNLADTDRLTGVAFPYVLGIQYKGEVDTFNSDGTTRIAFLADAKNGLETVYDLGITGKDDNGNLITGSVLDTWEAQQTGTSTTPGGGGGPPGGVVNPIVTQNVNGTAVDLIDLQSYTGLVATNYSITREAQYNNEVYFYRVDDITGSVGGVAVGSADYLRAAFDSIISPLFYTSNGNTESGTIQLAVGLLAPLIVSAGTLVQARAGSALVNTYTAYLSANSDDRTFDHVQVSNGSTFGFEDLFNGGDRDFNDIVITFNSWTGNNSDLTA
jgi:Domain of unknown function (DUF4114)/YHYH protein